MQCSCQRVQLLLQLSDPAIGFLLTLAAWLGNYTLSSGFGATFTRYLRMRGILIAAYFQTTTCLACARSFLIFTVALALLLTVVVLRAGDVLCGCRINAIGASLTALDETRSVRLRPVCR
jgi:hypothetical protein